MRERERERERERKREREKERERERGERERERDERAVLSLIWMAMLLPSLPLSLYFKCVTWGCTL